MISFLYFTKNEHCMLSSLYLNMYYIKQIFKTMLAKIKLLTLCFLECHGILKKQKCEIYTYIHYIWSLDLILKT